MARRRPACRFAFAAQRLVHFRQPFRAPSEPELRSPRWRPWPLRIRRRCLQHGRCRRRSRAEDFGLWPCKGALSVGPMPTWCCSTSITARRSGAPASDPSARSPLRRRRNDRAKRAHLRPGNCRRAGGRTAGRKPDGAVRPRLTGRACRVFRSPPPGSRRRMASRATPHGPIPCLDCFLRGGGRHHPAMVNREFCDVSVLRPRRTGLVRSWRGRRAGPARACTRPSGARPADTEGCFRYRMRR